MVNRILIGALLFVAALMICNAGLSLLNQPNDIAVLGGYFVLVLLACAILALGRRLYVRHRLAFRRWAGLMSIALLCAVTEAMAPYGVQVVQLAFTSPPRPPGQVKTAIEAKIAAIQSAERVENQKREATAEGEKIKAMAAATADANRLINSSITPQLVQWKSLDILGAKWDGRFSQVQGGSNPLLLNITPGR